MKTARALPQDAGELTAIAHAAKRHWGYPEDWISRWEGVLTLTPEYIAANPTHVALEDGRIVGFCSVVLHGNEARLEHLWVLPPAVNKGIGRSLFELAEGLAREAGADRLTVESDPNAEEFYVRMGAARYGRVPAAMDDVERFLPLLEKSLTLLEL
jgi:GNAT superfamily N-acetyltransferase